MGFFSSPRTRDWAAPRPPADPSRPSPMHGIGYGPVAQYQPHQQSGDSATTFKELSDLSRRMQDLQTGMTGLRDELQANRRASMYELPSHSTFQRAPLPPEQSMPPVSPYLHAGQGRPGSPFQPSANVLNATAAAQQAAAASRHPQYASQRSRPAPQSESLMDVDLDSMLRDGRQARARAATWPTSPNLFHRPQTSVSSQNQLFGSPGQSFPMDIPSQPRTPSPLPPFTFTRIGVPSAHPAPEAETPPCALPSMHPGSISMSGQFPDYTTMPGLSWTPSGSMDMSSSPCFPSQQNPFEPQSAGMPRASSSFQPRAPSSSRDVFGGSSFHFPDPFEPGQSGQFGHPAYQAGFGRGGGHLPPGFAGMAAGIHPLHGPMNQGMGLPGAMAGGFDGRSMSPRHGFGY